MSRFRRSSAVAPIARYLTPLRASGTSAGMISALKMTADRIALFGSPRRMTLSASSGPRPPGEVVRDRDRGQRAARHQLLLRDLDDLDQLRRVRVEVDHVAGLLRCRRAGV